MRGSLPGLAVDPTRLRAKIERALATATGAARHVRADLRKTNPRVTSDRRAQKYPRSSPSTARTAASARTSA